MDGVAAIVNSKVITYSDVQKYVAPVAENLRRSYAGQELYDKLRAAQLDALDSLIDRALIIQEYTDKGYSMPPNVVDTQLDEIIATDFGGDRTAFIKTLQAQDMTLSEYKDQLRDNTIIQGMTNHKLRQQIVVSPYKIETYYQKHLDDYKVEDQIKLRMIFVKKEPTPPATAPATTNATAEATSTNAVATAAAPIPPADHQRALAEEILAKLNEGDSFESLARVYSEGREAKQGGDWGWIGRDVLMKKLSAAAFALVPGQHSHIIETDDGYYILQVDDFRPAHVKPLSEVRDDIEKIIQQDMRTTLRQEWLKQLRAKAYIRKF